MARVYGFPLALLLLLACPVAGQDTPAAEPPPGNEAGADVASTAQTGTDGEAKADADPAPAETAADPSQSSDEERPPGAARDEEPAGAGEANTGSSLREEHIIYLPFEKLPEVFEDEDSSIVLPYAQFLEMWDRLAQPEEPPAGPPLNGVITRADYAGAVQGELVRLQATLDVEVLGADWARLPVEFGDAAIGSASTEDGAVLLRGTGEGRYELLVHGQGKHRIELSLVVGVETTTEGRSFAVQCPAVGVSNLELEIPEADVSVHVTPRRTSEVRSDREDATDVRAVLGSTNRFSVSWQPKSGSLEEAAGLANVNDAIAVEVGDGVVHTHAVFDYQILRGSLGELSVEMPVDQRLLDVQAPGLRDWQIEKEGGRQRVQVRLHAPATEEIRLEVHTETPISEEAFQVGGLRALGVARESGILAVRSAEDVDLDYVERQSVTRVDAAEAPESLRKPRSAFYKFFTPDHKLLVAASQLEPRIVVDSHIAVLLDKTRVTVRGEFLCEISRSGIFSLTYRLPAGFQLDDVHAESMERFEIASADNGQTLTVYLTKKRLGDLTVTVIASRTRDEAAGELTLPLPEPLNVTRERGLVAVIAPESLEVKTDSAGLESARAATPADLAARGFEPETPERSALAAAFSFVTRPVGIVQTVTERPRRTTVLVGTVADVKEDVLQVATTFDYRIQFAGTDTFRLAVPAAASDRLRIEGEGIRERRKADEADEADEDGTVEWTVVLHSEALGDYTFTATYDREITVPEKGAQFELAPIRALDVDRASGEIAVQKDRALSIEASPTGLEEIDPRELSQPVSATEPYLAYRYYQPPARLSLSVTKHELQEVVETVVRRAYIEAVVTEDGPVTMRARYELKSSERQRLPVTLRDPRILGLTVAGRSVSPEKGPSVPGGDPADKTYLINVARSTDSDQPFQIAMAFETPLNQEELQINDLLRLALPRFDEGVKFQKTYVRVWVPKEYRLVGTPEGFTSHIGVGLWDSRKITEAPDNPDRWFPDDTSSFDFQVGGTTYLFSSLTAPAELETTYWHIPTMTLTASLIVLLIGLALVPFSLETKVLAIFAALFGVLFAGLFLPSIVNSWLLAARMGIAGVVALWLVVWLLYVRRTGYSLAPAGGQGDAVAPASGEPAADSASSKADDGAEEASTADSLGEEAGDEERESGRDRDE